MATVQYTITNSAEFINVDGVVGTSVAGVSYSLKKINILKLTKKTAEDSMSIVMLDNTDFWFKYSEMIDPNTGMVFASLGMFETYLEAASGMSSSISTGISITVDGYVGKSATATGEDFSVTYLSPTTLTLGAYPPGITGFTATDIVAVKAFDSAGDVKTYPRDSYKMGIIGNTLTVGSGAVFNAADTFVVYTNVPRATSVSAGGAGGGAIVYTNAAGDFTATVTNGAKTITITGLPFTLEALHVVGGSIKKIAVTTNVVTTVPLTNVSVSGGVITLPNADNFATGDVVMVTLIGPDKAYDTALDNQLVAVQNPDYAHTTSVETLVAETNILGYKATADAGGDTDDIVDADGAFSVANIAEDFIAYQTTDGQSARILTTQVDAIPGVDSGTNISTVTLSGAATWASKAYSLPQVKRYEINTDGYNFLSIHYRLRCLTFCNAYLQLWSTLDSAATVDSDTAWVNRSEEFLGNVKGISVATSTSFITEDIVTIDEPSTMLKWMIKLVVESNSASPNTNQFTVFVKKSS